MRRLGECWKRRSRWARSPEAWFYLADSTGRSAPDRIGDAEAAVREALKRAPEVPWMQTLAGQIAYKKGDYKTAADHRQIAIRLQKDSADKGAGAPDPGKLFRTRPPQDW